MELVLNGQPTALVGSTTVAGLIAQLGFTGKRIAVERNGEIVPKSTYGVTALVAGDQLEIVIAVGGG